MLITLVIVSIWIISSAYFVNIENSDGYVTIANAKALLGQTPYNPGRLKFGEYFAERMPLNSILIMPAEKLARYLQLHAFDVRIHHLLFGLIHTLYLWLVYTLLRRHYNNELAVSIAFLATILNFIFFSYAPFLNPDIYPGAIFLIMLLLAQRFTTQPSWTIWLWLIILGACGPLIKHMYVFFWIIIICIYGWQLLTAKNYRTATWLFSGAVISAALAWIALSMALTKWHPTASFWLLPIEQINSIINGHPIKDQISWPWWFYLQNFAVGYGVLTTLLIIPGLTIAIKGKDTLAKNFAIAWIISFLIVMLIPYRETRYLAFLMPLTAFLVVNPIQWLLQHRRFWQIMAAFLLLFDITRSGLEATIIYNDFFSSNPIINFLQVIDATSNHQRPIFMPYSLSFVTEKYTPLNGDRLHRVTHLHQSTIIRLYNHPSIIGIGMPQSGKAKELQALQQPETFPPNTVLLLANKMLWRETGERGHYLTVNDDFVQIAALVERVIYKKTDNGYKLHGTGNGTGPFIIVRDKKDSGSFSFISLQEKLMDSDVTKFGFTPKDTIEVYGFRITAICKISECSFYSLTIKP